MAIITKPLGSFHGRCGSCSFEMDLDDSDGRVIELRCVNSFDKAAAGKFTRESDRRDYEQSFAKGNGSLTLPSIGANRLFVSLDALKAGKIRGVDLSFSSPDCDTSGGARG